MCGAGPSEIRFLFVFVLNMLTLQLSDFARVVPLPDWIAKENVSSDLIKICQ